MARMIEMIEAHGYYWPAGSEGYCERYVNRAGDMRKAMSHVMGNKVAVQAGGHCGVWPIWLATHIDAVYTFEPDAANFACMSRNVVASGLSNRIFAARGKLADGRAPLSISTNKVNIGGHKGKQEPGDIPTYRIDDLRLRACDLIVLDVEGMEVPALVGAQDTIKRHRPVLMLEDKETDTPQRYGWGGHDALHLLLAEYGYEVVDKKAKDIICASRSG